jgi:ketosteroid isomerase-like protein
MPGTRSSFTFNQWGRGKGSGASVESRFWQAWTIRDGKVVQGTHHSEKAEALQAVGRHR